MDKYAELRAALEQTCHALLIDDPDTIRALLAERDALREALDELANGYAGTMWDTGLVQRIKKARAALAHEQGEKHDNQD